MSSPRPMDEARRSVLTNEINVTPMIDVLLVLLIIFMAALPTRRKTMDVRLSDRERAAAPGAPSIVLEIDSAGGFSINRTRLVGGDLAGRIHAVYDGRPDKVLFVQADRRLRYEQVTDAMDAARGAGVTVIGWP